MLGYYIFTTLEANEYHLCLIIPDKYKTHKTSEINRPLFTDWLSRDGAMCRRMKVTTNSRPRCCLAVELVYGMTDEMKRAVETHASGAGETTISARRPARYCSTMMMSSVVQLEKEYSTRNS